MFSDSSDLTFEKLDSYSMHFVGIKSIIFKSDWNVDVKMLFTIFEIGILGIYVSS